MAESELWHDVRERVESLEPGAALRTPVSDRQFEVEVRDDRLVAEFHDSGEQRSLWRAQFGVLADQLREEAIPFKDLPPGVEPYVAAVSLTGDHAVVDGELRRVPEEAVGGESPLLVPPERARAAPEQVHDDAVLLADVLAEHDLDRPVTTATEPLVDAYVLLSDVQRGADDLRRSVGEVLLDRLGPGQQLSGTFGSVSRAARERRTPKEEERVLAALDAHDVPREWVLGVDPEKLDVVVATTDVDEEEVYDVEEGSYVRKTGVAEREKYDRLQGLRGRLESVEEETAEELREEIADLERRLAELTAPE